MKKTLSIIVIWFMFTTVFSQENSVIVKQSYTNSAVIIANGTNPEAVIDGDFQSKWESEAPLPTNYISDTALNILLKKNNIKPTHSTFVKATDGSTDNNILIKETNGVAQFALRFTLPKKLKLLSVKLNCKSQVQVQLHDNSGRVVYRKFYSPENNYQIQNFILQGINVSQISLVSEQEFMLFEIAAMDSNPKTEIVIDFKAEKTVGWVHTKHYAGENITKLTLYGKPERGSWEKLSELNPKALNPVTTRLKKNKRLRYLKLTYELNNKPYSKAFLWEIKTYDKSGPFGDFPTFHQPQQTLKESFGINGFWGWGSQKHADKIATDKAPFIFTDITKNLRYYHNMDWDVAAPDIKPDYKNMNSGSLNQNWLNWNREYIPLRKNGFDIIASIQFSNVFSDSSWKTPYKSAFQYGQAFAQYFGKFGNNTVKEIEIGNEPWGYSIKIYREILQGMANGIKSSDPSMKIFSCALDVAIDQPELNNNITNRLTQTELNLIDGINTHIYPYAYNKEGERYATFPEHPESGLRRILGIINYRDKYLAGKPIYLTEYGWDCSTKESDCSHNECVSEDAQAVYAVRSLLMLYRLGIEKMYWFFFADEDKSSFQFTRSGLLTSPKHEMKKKRSFFALQQLMQFAGDATLTKIISENDQAWIYLFTDNTGEKFIIAWVPLNHNNFKKETITLDKKYKVKAAYYLNGYRNNKINLPIRLNNNFKISPTPTIFVIN